MRYRQNTHQKIPLRFKYISGSRGGRHRTPSTPPPLA